ncbi:helix-turn-helix transcriptional regulator [Shouchella miscanthi]|uniref:Helix-turn-helix transcriptional regulator n=1 Tax=Shouchella miscanthi TaxID=2598861 RepID=A0ABU6NFY4_9BACI|nr:helix-turn-helix transcriptional regulator [Shouchella miscanthi]
MKGEIARKVHHLRKKNALTQAELSKGICTQAQISNIEKGILNPSSITLFHIAQRLNVDMNYFFDHQLEPAHCPQTTKDQIRLDAIKGEFQKVQEQLIAANLAQDDSFCLWHEALCAHYVDRATEEAISKLEKGYNKADTTSNQFFMLADLGSIYAQAGMEENAHHCFQTLLHRLDEQSPHVQYVPLYIRAYLGNAQYMFKKGEYAEAEYYCVAGEQMCLDYQVLIGLAQFFYIYGQCLVKRFQYDDARIYLKKAKKLLYIEQNRVKMDQIDELLALCRT